MVFIVCCGCTNQIEFDDELIPLDTEVTCPECTTVMEIELNGEGETNIVSVKRVSIRELKSDMKVQMG